MADMDVENERYSGFERFMFFFTPILFTIILLIIFMALFNQNMRNKMLDLGNRVPYLESVLPDPAESGSETASNEESAEKSRIKIDELRKQLNDKTAEVKAAQDNTAQAQDQIKLLQDEIDQLKKANEQKLLDDEQYAAKISEVAAMYTQMTPSKAAPILQSMSTEEAVLVLDAMPAEKRSRILEKMNPQKAADASLMLKDVTTAKDRQIAALQAQLERQSKAANTPAQTQTTLLDTQQLKQTFGTMAPKSAAELLIKMSDISPSKVLRILNAVDDSTRASIVAEMSALNEGITAQLVSKLMSGK